MGFDDDVGDDIVFPDTVTCVTEDKEHGVVVVMGAAPAASRKYEFTPEPGGGMRFTGVRPVWDKATGILRLVPLSDD